MLFGKIDLPDEVWAAALEGRLAIFAGAGVSMGPPANLPSFHDLAVAISRDLGGHLQPTTEELDDEYLGRLVESKVPVHARVAAQLSDAKPEPTEVHRALVRLFKEPAAVRIVTTNFDRLFEAAVEAKWPGAKLEIFDAPALPVGSRFQGLVHLHGDLAGPYDRMVLTDADFSRAYLTEGWARRFVRELAQGYVVLFVGFSFNDVPSRYLLRGLPVERARNLAALVPENGVARVPGGVFRLAFDPMEDFQELRVGLDEFSRFVAKGEAQHYEELKGLAAAGPPGPGPAADYIAWALRNPVFSRYLTEAAAFASPEWLDWVNARGLLEFAFTSSEKVGESGEKSSESSEESDEAERDLLRWYCRLALADPTWKACAELLAKNWGRLSIEGWWWLEDALWRRVAALKEANGALGARESFWIGLLRSPRVPVRRHSALGYLLGDLTVEGEQEFLELWSELARPRIALSSSTRYPGDDRDRPAVRCGIALEVDHYSLNKSWSKARPSAGELAPRLLPILVDALEAAHRLLRLTDEAASRFDSENYRRTAIAAHPQEREYGHSAFSILIDATRDCLVALFERSPEAATGWETVLLRCESPLARRIGIHSFALHAAQDPDRALTRVVDERWLSIPGAKPEAFEVFKRAFPGATAQASERLLSSLAPPPVSEDEEPDPDRRRLAGESRASEWFDLLAWLSEANPQDPLVQAELAKVQSLRPELVQREYPELDHGMGEGGLVQPISPFTDDEVKGWGGQEIRTHLGEIHERGGKNFLIDEQRGFLEQLGRIAASDLDWGTSRAEELAASAADTRHLVAAILEGWERQQLPVADLRRMIQWASKQAWLRDFSGELARALEKSLKQVADDLDSEGLDQAVGLVSRLWSDAPALEDGEDRKDWLHLALNHPQGSLGLSVLHLASAWKKQALEGGVSPPEPLTALMREMLRADTQTHPLGRVILASQLHFFFAAYEAFALEEILPWFSWRDHREHSLQAWDGYLQWGRLYPSLLAKLLPSMREYFSALPALGSRRRRFAEFVAHAALLPGSHPVEGGWLNEYLQAAEPKDRAHWAAWLAGQLERLEDKIAREVWRRWLGRWVQAKLTTGFPPVADDELVELFRLLLALPAEQVDEALPWFVGHPAPPREDTFILHRLEERVGDLGPGTVLNTLLLLFEHAPRWAHFSPETIRELARKLAMSTNTEGKSRLRDFLVRAHLAGLADGLLGTPRGLEE